MKVKIIIFLAVFLLTPLISFSLNEEDESFYKAVKAFNDGFYEAGKSLFERFVNEFPQSSRIDEVNLYIAKCYFFKENYPKALEILLKLNQKQSLGIIDEVYYWLGEVYFKGKNFKVSLENAIKVVDNYPASRFYWWANYLTANNYWELGKNRDAESIFKKIIDNSKEREIVENAYSQLLNLYFKERNYDKVVSFADRYLKDYPEGMLVTKVCFFEAKSYYAQKKFDKAISSYQKALELSNETYMEDSIRQGLGFTYLEEGDNGQAKDNIDKIKDAELRIFSEGVYYFKVKDYLPALDKFEYFIENFPESNFLAGVYLNKADALYEVGRVNDSLSLYTLILSNFKVPEYKDVIDKAHYGLAWCYLKNGEFKKAIEEFKNTLEYTGNPIVKESSQVQIADASQEAGNYSEALDMYNKILQNNPNTIYADYIQFQLGMIFLKTNKLESALLALRNLQKTYPSSKLIPEAQYYLAVGYFSAAQYDEAKNLLEEFISKFPQSGFLSQVYYLYGKCFFNEGDFNKAIDNFRIIISKFKNKEIEELVYIDMGNAYLNLSEFNKAKNTWEDFLAKFSKSQYAPSISLYLGGLYEKDEDYSRAEKYYKRVIDDFKDSVYVNEAVLSLGHLYWQNKQLDKAQTCFEKLTSKEDSPLSSKAKLYLANVYAERGDGDKALSIYDELISLSSSISGAAALEKAEFLKELKDYAGAIISFKKAISAGIDSPQLRFYLGVCLEKNHQNQEAIDEFFKVIYIFNDDEYKIKSYFRVARIYEEEGNINAAKEIYKKIQELNIEEAKIAEARLKELE